MKPLLLAPLILLLWGCAQLGLQPPPRPSTTSEAFAAAYASVEQAYDAIAVAMDNPTTPLSRADAIRLKSQVDNFYLSLDTAHQLWSQGKPFSDQPLVTAESLLRAVRKSIAEASDE